MITSNIAQKFLKEFKSSNSEETMDILIEVLENKVDPDPSELYLLESLYILKEKIKITESKLTSYIQQTKNPTSGDKLSELYDRTEPYGTSKLFKN